MRAGELQQVGTPRKLDENPVDLFVARFIGSPSMSFLSGEVRDGRVRLPFGDIPVPAGVQHKGNVVAGLRPEDFEDAALSTGKDGVTFRTNIDLLESMGYESYAHFEVESEDVSSEQLDELAADAGAEDLGGDASQIVARLDADSRVQQGQGGRAGLRVRQAAPVRPGLGRLATRPGHAGRR